MARIWKSGADKIKVTVRHSDSQSHYAYTTARRTLCGRALEKVNFWKFINGSGQESLPDCFTCRRIVQVWQQEGLIPNPHREKPVCPALTRKGEACCREPKEGEAYCPSHQHLASVVV